MEKESVFSKLNGVNVNDHTEKKNGLTYLSWAWAWAEVKKLYPGATYQIYERDTTQGPVNYFTDGMTCWVKTGVTIEGLEHVEELPVMDFKNRSIPLEVITSMDVNKAIQRSLTKACARHGLGLYIYAGEDLPEEEQGQPPASSRKKAPGDNITCDECDAPIRPYAGKQGTITPEEWLKRSMERYGKCLCRECAKKAKASISQEWEESRAPLPF